MSAESSRGSWNGGPFETDDEAIRLRARETRYAAALSAVAVGLVAWTTATYPVSPRITLSWGGLDPAVAILAGVGYWSLFGLVGALWSRYQEGGTVLTFHMPFVVAGTILGGPVVGGWMGLLSQFERREFETVPWYGLLGNHAIIAIAAVAAGAAGDGVGVAATRAGAGEGAVQFASAVAVAGTFALINFALVMPLVAWRTGRPIFTAARAYDGIFRVTFVAEGIVAWLMALAYVDVGWWAPIACVAVVLTVWDAQDMWRRLIHDPMTGLLNDRGLRPLLVAAIRIRPPGSRVNALLMIDLDKFGPINKEYGEQAGDEMIVATGRKLAAAVRQNDAVARQHKAGDEFSILLMDLPDPATAVTLAWRIHARICEPILLRGRGALLSVGASIGVVILGDEAATADLAIRRADHRMQVAKLLGLGVLAQDLVEPDTSDGAA